MICLAAVTLAAMPFLTILLSSAAALLGRWIQLHPEKILPRSQFAEDSVTGRIYRVQIACMGSFAVFAGTWSAVLEVCILFLRRMPVTHHGALLAGAALGIVAVIYVRKEVATRQRRESGIPRVWQ